MTTHGEYKIIFTNINPRWNSQFPHSLLLPKTAVIQVYIKPLLKWYSMEYKVRQNCKFLYVNVRFLLKPFKKIIIDIWIQNKLNLQEVTLTETTECGVDGNSFLKCKDPWTFFLKEITFNKTNKAAYCVLRLTAFSD